MPVAKLNVDHRKMVRVKVDNKIPEPVLREASSTTMSAVLGWVENIWMLSLRSRGTVC